MTTATIIHIPISAAAWADAALLGDLIPTPEEPIDTTNEEIRQVEAVGSAIPWVPFGKDRWIQSPAEPSTNNNVAMRVSSWPARGHGHTRLNLFPSAKGRE